MSPLACIRQAAAGIVSLILLAPGALAGDTPSPSTSASAAQSTAGQLSTSGGAQSAAMPPAAGAAQPIPAAQSSRQPASVQPAQPVVLAPNATAQIARSALLIVDGTAAADALQLKFRRASDGSLVNGGDVTVTVDGKNEPVTHENGGGYEVPINDLRGDGSRDSARDVDIIVAHDGIREILSSKVAVAEAPSGGGLLGDHKQITWWILNIVIVFIAAMIITRRKS